MEDSLVEKGYFYDKKKDALLIQDPETGKKLEGPLQKVPDSEIVTIKNQIDVPKQTIISENETKAMDV
ncbi:MAG: hypothetical protein KDK36_10645 [Leptospiraceae bacterium]|nr:hypothetical protein [Leptospiraceae bacterium]